MKRLLSLVFLLSIPVLANAVSLNLGWDDDPNNTAVEFRMYKQLSCTGSFSPVADIIYPTQTYTDPNLATGVYCYKVTGLDAQSVESGPSNTLRVTCVKHGHNVTCTGV